MDGLKFILDRVLALGDLVVKSATRIDKHDDDIDENTAALEKVEKRVSVLEGQVGTLQRDDDERQKRVEKRALAIPNLIQAAVAILALVMSAISLFHH